ncbi:cysteine--tRNA ligase [Thermopolyspora sp. NPDC052614]|uniref:cysteine--tRNA ligase n=1 Tax=Thermopolyspora sp. NPDC052614 TaxID=3155682 RepID=UPI00344811F7
MSLRLYDTYSRAVQEFTPRRGGEVSIYICGPTVVVPPHVGQLRCQVGFDVLARWMEYLGCRVTLCRNVTDMEDMILRRAFTENVPWWLIAEDNYRSFFYAYDLLNCLPPTVEPRATGHVLEMIELIEELIKARHAYVSDGDVYFSVSSFPEYGRLSRQRREHIRLPGEPGAGKRDPSDFALWKRAKPGEPFWQTPWGEGRPGWHLQCSVMARKYLGREFDIHAGGAHLIFPHHENEIAQSRAAGDRFARFWLHGGTVTRGGEKIHKSADSPFSLARVLADVRPIELRYYLATPHYRSDLEFSRTALRDAAAAFRRIEGFALRASHRLPHAAPAAEVPAEFAAAMNNDLNVPRGLTVVWAAVNDGNRALAAGDEEGLADAYTRLRAMLGVLGLDPLDERWARRRARDARLEGTALALADLVTGLADTARARGDDALADRLLAQVGVAMSGVRPHRDETGCPPASVAG